MRKGKPKKANGRGILGRRVRVEGVRGIWRVDSVLGNMVTVTNERKFGFLTSTRPEIRFVRRSYP